MIWLLSVIAFVVIFSLLILIHELGHFTVARRCGIKVTEFGLGLPPRLWGFKPKKSETLYSINAIPFGGFVRLYGEDSHSAKVLKDKKSFAAQKPWKKMAVVVAGVLMNFLLAFVLLTIGLTWGMQPLFVTPDDVYNGINNGVVQLEQGIIVKENGANDIGFMPGDRILSVNGVKITLGDEVENLKDREKVTFHVKRGNTAVDLTGINDSKKPFFTAYDPMGIPKLVVKRVDPQNRFGLQTGDIIDRINGRMIFTPEDLQRELISTKQPLIDVIKQNGVANGSIFPMVTAESDSLAKQEIQPIIISGVITGSNAETAGILEGDEVLSINGVKLTGAGDFQKALKTEQIKDKMVYVVRRAGSEIEFYVRKGEGGRIGVLLSETIVPDQSGLVFYTKTLPYSIMKISDVSYPVWQALGQAILEMGRLSVLTAEMFVNVLGSIFTRLSVPEGVAGPVGIAQMTFVFVQEGFMSLLRFTALLSLSLGIINILPFPGLDGGRFFLILIPALIGRKLNPRWEALIHVFGFLVLMLLIFLVTFNDIVRLFVK